MGTRLYASHDESHGACRTDAPAISARARVNRATLGAVLTEAGFMNCPTEWWHWSLGDRYWSLATGQPFAPYGLVEPS